MKDGLPAFVYRTLLKPAPLRWAANKLILLILPKTVRLPEGILSLNREDPVISGALMLGVYEKFELELFRHVLQEGMIVFDIGANIGIYTLIAAAHVGRSGVVIACEPEPTNYALLHKNCAQNNLENVRLYDCAVADKEDSMELYLSETNKGHHSLVAQLGSKANFSKSISVSVRTGDDLLRDAQVQKVDVLKIDIEGAEPLAFIGLEHTLQAPHMILFFELSPSALRDLGFEPIEFLQSLDAHGFSIFEIEEQHKTISRKTDYTSFVRQFKNMQYTNLFCVKGGAGKETVAKYQNTTRDV